MLAFFFPFIFLSYLIKYNPQIEAEEVTFKFKAKLSDGNVHNVFLIDELELLGTIKKNIFCPNTSAKQNIELSFISENFIFVGVLSDNILCIKKITIIS